MSRGSFLPYLSVSLSSPGFPPELPLFPPSSFTLRRLLLDSPVQGRTPGFTLPRLSYLSLANSLSLQGGTAELFLV